MKAAADARRGAPGLMWHLGPGLCLAIVVGACGSAETTVDSAANTATDSTLETIESDAATITPITPLEPPTSDSRVEVSVFDIDDREAAPDISGLTLDGKQLALSDFLGQVVIVNTWASWCPPCEDELPLLIEIGESYSRDGVTLLGLNVQDQRADAKRFAERIGIDFPSIVDTDGRLLASLPGVPPRALPSTLIIDRNGNIGARIVGPVKPGVIEKILNEWLTPG